MPLQETSGNATADAYGGGVATVINYIEDVFSTYLYTGNGSTGQSIVNGIDLSTKGGFVWIKDRANAQSHALFDTLRGPYNYLSSNTTTQQVNYNPSGITAFNTTGFSVADAGGYLVNTSTRPYVSWTFRKQPKFFDVVTYTGNGTNPTNISHSLASKPGFIVIKCTSVATDWIVWHRVDGVSTDDTGYLNKTDAFFNGTAGGYLRNSTSTYFQVGGSDINTNGRTYVAYIFAHNAGGFGLTGTDNVISCGSFTTDSGANATVNLGYEPQFILFKRIDSTTGGDWYVYDTMRGMPNNAGTSITAAPSLSPNTSAAELNWQQYVNATGFVVGPGAYSFSYSSASYIYIAIRRGPMKVPTTGTSVFKPNAYTGTGAVLPITGMGFPPDFLLTIYRPGGNDWCAQDKLRGPSQYLRPNGTIAELNLGTAQLVSIDQDGVTYGNGSSYTNFNGGTYINLSFRRAPSFFDEVCYTGIGSATTFNHNLGAVPEMMIVKNRDTAQAWAVYVAPVGNTAGMLLNGTNAPITSGNFWNNTTPTSTVFSVGPSANTGTVANYVAYLFATCAGVSKVFSFTGNGSTQAIACGFTGGARFVLIKATSTTGNWLVFDTARGMTTSTDPWLVLNLTSAESATSGACTTTTGGFTVDESKLTGVNTNGVSYIGLAVA